MILTALIPVTIAATFSFAGGCLIYFRKSAPLRILMIYSVIHAATLMFILYAFRMHKYYGLWLVLNFFLLTEFFCFLGYLRKKVKSDLSSRFLQFLQQVFPLFFVYSLLYAHSPGKMNVLLFLLHHLLIVIACFIYYHEMMFHPPEYILEKIPAFWVVGGIASSCMVCAILGFVLFVGQAYDTQNVLLARTGSGFTLSACLMIALKYQLHGN